MLKSPPKGRYVHGEIGDDLLVEDANPDRALRLNDGVKNELRPPD
jgi:hypothetical protein